MWCYLPDIYERIERLTFAAQYFETVVIESILRKWREIEESLSPECRTRSPGACERKDYECAARLTKMYWALAMLNYGNYPLLLKGFAIASYTTLAEMIIDALKEKVKKDETIVEILRTNVEKVAEKLKLSEKVEYEKDLQKKFMVVKSIEGLALLTALKILGKIVGKNLEEGGEEYYRIFFQLTIKNERPPTDAEIEAEKRREIIGDPETIAKLRQTILKTKQTQTTTTP